MGRPSDFTPDADGGETTPEKHRGLKEAWAPGQSGNPSGRPKGSRNKLGEAFLNDFLADWETNGKAAIQTMRENRPHEYVKVAASILPKELNVRVSELDDLSDDELDHRISALARALRLEIGTGEAASGAQTQSGSTAAH